MEDEVFTKLMQLKELALRPLLAKAKRNEAALRFVLLLDKSGYEVVSTASMLDGALQREAQIQFHKKEVAQRDEQIHRLEQKLAAQEAAAVVMSHRIATHPREAAQPLPPAPLIPMPPQVPGTPPKTVIRMLARYDGHCCACSAELPTGTPIQYSRKTGRVRCEPCADAGRMPVVTRSDEANDTLAPARSQEIGEPAECRFETACGACGSAIRRGDWMIRVADVKVTGNRCVSCGPP